MLSKDIELSTVKELWKSATDGYLPILIEIFNPDIKWESGMDMDNMYLRLINDSTSVIYKGKKYYPCKFTFTPPEENGKKVGDASLVVSGIDSRIMAAVTSIDIPCDVYITAFFAKNGSTFMFRPLDSIKLTMDLANCSPTTITFTLSFKELLNINAPVDVATGNKFFSIADD